MKEIYIAGPFSTDQERESLKKMIELVKKNFPDYNLYIPMEYKVEGDFQKEDGTWNLPNHEWARKVYLEDLKHLENAKYVIAMYLGRQQSSTGTAWELGYSCAYGINTIIYIPGWAKSNKMSLMVLNSALGYMEEDGEMKYVKEDTWKNFDQK